MNPTDLAGNAEEEEGEDDDAVRVADVDVAKVDVTSLLLRSVDAVFADVDLLASGGGVGVVSGFPDFGSTVIVL